jgi:hypothetical protein
MTDKVVSANRLRDGVPIYFAGNGVWSTKVAEALSSDDGDALLAQAQADAGFPQAIDAFVVEVVMEQGALRPILLRERIRAFGPTV